MSIRVFNKLPEHVTNLAGNKKIFISTLRQYLVGKALYSLDEFLNGQYPHVRSGLAWPPLKCGL
jgi:hypothetical protein